IYAICALSMNMVNGFTGLFSLGQPGFMAIGAYVTAFLTVSASDKISIYKIVPISDFMANLSAPFFVALILGGIIAAVFAFFIGFPVLRLKGDYLAIATLGFSEIIRIFITNAQGITNGPTGINRIPNTYMNMYVVTGILVLIVIFILAMMKTSYGRALLAIREDEVAAQAMGINLFRHKMLAFVISGFIAGIGGGLLASLVGAIGPDQFKFTVAYDILLMVILGGQGSVSGCVVGAFIVRIALEKLRFLDEPIDFGFFQYEGIGGMRMVIFSALLMVVIILWRQGIFGNKEFSWDRIFNFFAKFKKAPKKEAKE
ncbi:MAG: branched-chain amino acid ABC transporter permease, partial [Lachnospirales bacterium]